MKCYILPKKQKSQFNLEAVRQYKRQYYMRNKPAYTKRNATASQQKTIERIEKLSSPEIIYKLNVILKHFEEQLVE